jgi:hypothetical protein
MLTASSNSDSDDDDVVIEPTLPTSAPAAPVLKESKNLFTE